MSVLFCGSLASAQPSEKNVSHKFPWFVENGKLRKFQAPDLNDRLMFGDHITGEVMLTACLSGNSFSSGFRMKLTSQDGYQVMTPGLTCKDKESVWMGYLRSDTSDGTLKKSGKAYDIEVGKVGDIVPFSVRVGIDDVTVTFGDQTAVYPKNFAVYEAYFYGFCGVGVARFFESAGLEG
ncbi:MAG: hypothetical protein CMK09_02430 [Ponticaulis sp.]|nr:hypothetical protein [Ponticaulis sp.]